MQKDTESVQNVCSTVGEPNLRDLGEERVTGEEGVIIWSSYCTYRTYLKRSSWCQAINTHTAILLWRVHQVYPKAMEQISLPFLRRR